MLNMKLKKKQWIELITPDKHTLLHTVESNIIVYIRQMMLYYQHRQRMLGITALESNPIKLSSRLHEPTLYVT